jgi:hypothetical protein
MACSGCEILDAELKAAHLRADFETEKARNHAREQYLRFCDLYPALLTVMRAIENGHPVGHDAVLQARRALRRAHVGEVPPWQSGPVLQLFCVLQ